MKKIPTLLFSTLLSLNLYSNEILVENLPQNQEQNYIENLVKPSKYLDQITADYINEARRPKVIKEEVIFEDKNKTDLIENSLQNNNIIKKIISIIAKEIEQLKEEENITEDVIGKKLLQKEPTNIPEENFLDIDKNIVKSEFLDEEIIKIIERL